MSRIDGPSGPGPISQHLENDYEGVATVRVGENRLADVADRLGIDRHALQNANPNLPEGASLKAGQEIRLPQRQDADSSAKETASSLTSKYIGETEKNLRK